MTGTKTAKPTPHELSDMLTEALNRWPGEFGPQATGAVLDVVFVLDGIDDGAKDASR